MPSSVILQIVYEASEIVAIFLLGVMVKLPVGQVHHVRPASVRHRLPLEVSSHCHSHRAHSLYSSGLGAQIPHKEESESPSSAPAESSPPTLDNADVTGSTFRNRHTGSWPGLCVCPGRGAVCPVCSATSVAPLVQCSLLL